MEIGSVYEINPLSIPAIDDNIADRVELYEISKYDKKNIAYTASGREAIALALYSIEKEYPDICKKCFMPVYMCDTVFIPFVQRGWELIFYHIGKDMKADVTEIEALLQREDAGVFFLHPYYGVDTWKELRPLLSQYQKEGLILMEDVTQSYYLDIDTQADYIVGSLRKWYAIPDGGFIASDHEFYTEIVESDETFSKERLGMQIKKWNYLKAIDEPIVDKKRKQVLQADKQEYLASNRMLEDRLDRFTKITDISEVSNGLLKNINEEEYKCRRNENCRILFEGLKNRKTVFTVLGENIENASPLYFPVYMLQRGALQQYLRERDIYVPVLWPVGKENEDFLNEGEQYIYTHIAAIPMDQRYGKENMERIVSVINEFEEKCG